MSGEAVGGFWTGVVLCLFVRVPLGLLLARDAGERGSLYAGAVVVLGAVALVVLRGIHDPAIVAGDCVTVPMLWRTRWRRAEQEDRIRP